MPQTLYRRIITTYRRPGLHIFAGGMVAGLAAGLHVSDTQTASQTALAGQEPSTRQIEAVVHDYLMRDPQIVRGALVELQRREAEQEALRRSAAVIEHHDALFADPATPTGGATRGDVLMVEFFDYRCGYCRHAVAAVEGLIERDAGLTVVFKELPILGEESQRAARAALASHRQGAYERFHFALMGADDLSEQGIRTLAQANGLDADRLVADMQRPEIDAAIDRNRTLAKALGVNGTPAFVIGDQVVPGAVGQERLEELIADTRATIRIGTASPNDAIQGM